MEGETIESKTRETERFDMTDTPNERTLKIALETFTELASTLKRERDEARVALREIWQSGDAFLPYIDKETTNRWRKAAGWEEIK